MALYAVTRDTGEALYSQIARHLEQEVAQRYQAGERLPSEGELAIQFGVNRHTLRRAIDELIAAGMLERRHGLGVFVLDVPLDYRIGSHTRFTENLAALGVQTEVRVLRKQRIPAIAAVARKLGIAERAPVAWLETLRSSDARPLCLISHFLPAARFPDLLDCYDGGSLHQLLTTRFDCQVRRDESLVTAVMPQGDDARLLGAPQNRPVLRVKSVNIDQHEQPVEYAITRFRADRVQLSIHPSQH